MSPYRLMEVAEVCGYTEEVTVTRFVYISVCGVLAVLGCISNLVLLYIFTKKRLPNSPPNLFPGVLAFLDSILCILFVFVFVVDVNMIYLNNTGLFVFYHEYIICAFATAKIVQFLIPYMLMLATMERYTWIANRYRHFPLFKPHGRYISLLVVFLVSLALRVPSGYSLKITEFPDCPDPLRRLAVDIKDWAKDRFFFIFYDFYGIAFLQTFLPFLILMFLNVIIVNRLAKIDSKNRNPKSNSKVMLKRRSVRLMQSLNFTKMPTSVRNAVFTMVAIVSTYLFSNSLHILLTILEVGKASVLVDENDPHKASSFYTLLGDGVSILYMTSSAIRIVIYIKCNRTIRKQIVLLFRSKKVILLQQQSNVSQSHSYSQRIDLVLEPAPL